MPLTIPNPLVTEHEALHERLVALTRLTGATGSAAREVARRLHVHFEKEERYALPPLGLLAELAGTGVNDAMAPVVAMAAHLEAELSQMLAEHRDIVAALQALRAAARAEERPDALAFADALESHAAVEEQVMYPAAVLVGRLVAQGLAQRELAVTA